MIVTLSSNLHVCVLGLQRSYLAACLLFVITWSLPKALELLLRAHLNENWIWSFPCFLPQFPRKMLPVQGIGNGICWPTHSGAFLHHFMLCLSFCKTLLFRKTSPTPHNFTFLEICDCKSQTKVESLIGEPLSYYHIQPFLRCPGSLSYLQMPKSWSYPLAPNVLLSLGRAVFLVAFPNYWLVTITVIITPIKHYLVTVEWMNEQPIY